MVPQFIQFTLPKYWLTFAINNSFVFLPVVCCRLTSQRAASGVWITNLTCSLDNFFCIEAFGPMTAFNKLWGCQPVYCVTSRRTPIALLVHLHFVLYDKTTRQCQYGCDSAQIMLTILIKTGLTLLTCQWRWHCQCLSLPYQSVTVTCTAAVQELC